MMTLQLAVQRQKKIRVLGIDDAPFQREQDEKVNISAILCANTRFEGMLWAQVQQDGLDATDVLINTILKSKFHSQLHLVLIDGLAVAGFNLIDLPRLAKELQLPCVSIMRKLPNMSAIKKALQHLPHYEQRIALIEKAGEIHTALPFYFQVQGESAEVIAHLLPQLTDQGHVPEALRLAHLIGSAVMTGESSRRA